MIRDDVWDGLPVQRDEIAVESVVLDVDNDLVIAVVLLDPTSPYTCVLRYTASSPLKLYPQETGVRTDDHKNGGSLAIFSSSRTLWARLVCRHARL